MKGRIEVARIAMGRFARFVPAVKAAGPAFAAPSLSDMDWHSYVDWQSHSELQWLLLGGSIALLVVALLLWAADRIRSTRASRETLAPGARFTRRIGTMPIEPPNSVDVAS